ncbi:low molecular weight phosphotyrosine protein phosphatase-like isoform X2 [Melitaea cinxia]|uniref:low molecular weight phosphotyrosine protein phosphatase-like isoform X2 n=1 Tax=Melitaea cinxia TaxID=113334 RepID=UPI001E270FF6|nr:low molecular weight phosphotyrosine protein phosphatase-like isoform X2 [Melitaea cinxia]XP_045449480.1 low molecular weight phosphotyrosine protein phosphatase-like isoform X2 [Melitaea cinxia]XP_045449485.1 low molecular weight phosphotyrosine protein phosphatase-like isoform X2 [Melitaea cinxia]
MAEETKKKALMVCLEAVFQHTVNKMGVGYLWEVDSAGLAGWNVGNSPTHRALNTMKKHGLRYNNLGRQITKEDFNNFDFIFGMDQKNISDLKSMAPENCKAKIFLFGEFDPEGERIIRDPYFDNDERGFEKAYEQAVRCAKGFLEQLDKGNVK